MPLIEFANNAASVIAAPISNAAVTVVLQAGGGTLFPAPVNGQYFCLTFYDVATGLTNEIVHVTNVTGDTLTIVRGQEGTSAKNWLANDVAVNDLTAGQMLSMAQVFTFAGNPNGNVAGTVANGGYPPSFCVDTVGNNLYVCTTTGPAATAIWTLFIPQSTFAGQTLRVGAALASANAALTVTADQIGVAVTLGGAGITLANFNKILNTAIVGAGGMDTGLAPISGFVAIYAIWGPSGAIALLGTTASQTTIYSGGNMPAGYTMSALVSVWPTNGSRQLVAGFQVDRVFGYAVPPSVLSSANNTTTTPINVSGAVPSASRRVSLLIGAIEESLVTANSGLAFGTTAVAVDGMVSAGLYTVTSVAVGGQSDSTIELPILTSSTFYFRSGQPTMFGAAAVTGYYL